MLNIPSDENCSATSGAFKFMVSIEKVVPNSLLHCQSIQTTNKTTIITARWSVLNWAPIQPSYRTFIWNKPVQNEWAQGNNRGTKSSAGGADGCDGDGDCDGGFWKGTKARAQTPQTSSIWGLDGWLAIPIVFKKKFSRNETKTINLQAKTWKKAFNEMIQLWIKDNTINQTNHTQSQLNQFQFKRTPIVLWLVWLCCEVGLIVFFFTFRCWAKGDAIWHFQRDSLSWPRKSIENWFLETKWWIS